MPRKSPEIDDEPEERPFDAHVPGLRITSHAVDTSKIRPGCPHAMPLVRGPKLKAVHVPRASIPRAAEEYHLVGATWLPIPEHWR